MYFGEADGIQACSTLRRGSSTGSSTTHVSLFLRKVLKSDQEKHDKTRSHANGMVITLSLRNCITDDSDEAYVLSVCTSNGSNLEDILLSYVIGGRIN